MKRWRTISVSGETRVRVRFLLATVIIAGLWTVTGVAAETTQNLASSLITQGKLQRAEQELRTTLERDPQNATALALLGQVRWQQHKYQDAETLFKHAIQANSSSSFAREQLARLYADEERTDESIAAYQTLLKLLPQNVNVKTELAVLYQRSGENKKSLELALSIPAARRPAKLLPVIAAANLALNQTDAAQEAVGQVLRRATANPELVPLLAKLFLLQDAPGDADHLLRIAGQHQTMTAPFLAVQAEVESNLGESEQAKATVDKALAMDPKLAEALLEKAHQEGRAGNWQAAVGLLQKILKNSPPRVAILQSLVFAALQADDLQTAHDAALDLYEINPQRPDSVLSLAVVLVRALHWGEAKPLLEEMLTTNPEDKRALLALGIVEYNLGDTAAAKKLLLRSLGQGSTDAEAHYTLGLLAKQSGEIAEAAQQMEAALAANPNKPEAMSSLGQLYLQLNQPEQARALLEKAAVKIPNDAQTHYQLGLAYRKLGFMDKAREQMEIFQKLSARKVPQPPGETAVPLQ